MRYIYVDSVNVASIDHPKSIQLRFYSVAVITSGSDASSSSRRAYPSPGDPGSIPGKTYCFASDLYITFVFLLIFSM